MSLVIIVTRIVEYVACNPCRARASLYFAICHTNQIDLVGLQIFKQAIHLPSSHIKTFQQVCMENYRHAWGTKGADRALLTRLADHKADQAEALTIRARQEEGYQGRIKPAFSSQIY